MKKFAWVFVFIWVATKFWSLNDLVTFLNTIPPAQQQSAKVMLDPRLGFYLIYEKEGS